MALTNDTKMPTDEELTVPQEITLSTPWLKAVAVYMARNCENDIKVSCFMYKNFLFRNLCCCVLNRKIPVLL